MTAWVIWIVLAAVLVIIELATGTFYLLMIAIGLGAGGLAASVGASVAVQSLVAAISGIVATAALRRSRFGKRRRVAASADPNVNLDVGQRVKVEQWQLDGDTATARVAYRGAMWDIELVPTGVPQPGTFVIQEIRGSHLVVNNQSN